MKPAEVLHSLRWLALGLLAGCAAAASGHEVEQPAVPAMDTAPMTWTREPPPSPLELAETPTESRRAVHRFRLPNGLTVIAESRRAQPIVSLRLVFGHGHTSDPVSMPGATYFAVTLLGDYYEETVDGDEILGEKSLRRQVWERGGTFGTFVDADSTSLALEGYSEDLPEYLRILATAVIDPRRGEGTFIQRRDNMIHELEELSFSDDLGFASILRQMAFGTDHPYGRFAFGTVRTLKALDFREVIMHQRRLLNPSTSTLVVVGDFAPDSLERWVHGEFGTWRARGPRLDALPRLPSPRKKRRHLLIPQPFAATMGICATLPLAERSNMTMRVLSEILGGNFQSRLGEVLRRENGLAYSFFAEVTEQKRADALLSCTRVPKEQTELALRLFTRVLSSFETNAPTEAELTRAKASIRARILARHESVRASMDTWMDELTAGEYPSEEEELRTLEAVNAEGLSQLAQSLDLAQSVRFVLAGDERAARAAAASRVLGRLEVVSGSL